MPPTDLLLEPFRADFMARALLGASLVAVVCAIAGTWVVVRGMAFLGEAMAHGMLPGVAAASLLGVHPLVGAAASAAAMSAGVSYLGRGGKLGDDTVIGLLFVAMLATGVIIVSQSRSFAVDLTAILFGDVLAIRPADIAVLTAALVAAVAVAAAFHRGFVALSFDARVAAVLGLRPRLSRAVLVGLVTLAVVASYSAVGTLLVVGLLLAPAVAAGQWVARIPAVIALAAVFGVTAVYLGLVVSWHAATAAGASIAAAAIALAALSALARAAVGKLTKARTPAQGAGPAPSPTTLEGARHAHR